MERRVGNHCIAEKPEGRAAGRAMFVPMPVIVVGADTPLGGDITSRLAASGGEVRVFISDPSRGDEFRGMGCKVAIGDVSDGSHIEFAAHECFTAVLIAAAALDSRERSFAASSTEVTEAWMSAVAAADVQRLIWIGSPELPEPPDDPPVESAVLSDRDPDVAAEVVRLNDLRSLP